MRKIGFTLLYIAAISAIAFASYQSSPTVTIDCGQLVPVLYPQTPNHVSALRTGAYYIQPISAHWGAKFGASVTSQKFTQPNGAAAGTYRVSSFRAT